MDIFKLGDKILALLEAVFGFWNNQISLIFDLLGQSPDAFKGGGPWNVIAGIPGVRFLMIAAVILSLGEIIMHLFLFNVRLKTIYNPGLITGLFGIGTIVIIYLVISFNPSLYMWYDYLIGLIYFAFVFWLCFRSPMYWSIGRIKGYPLTDRTAYGLEINKIS